MSKNALAGAVTLCGVGLFMIGGALLMQSGSLAYASVNTTPAAVATLAATATAQAGPTVVWYGTYGGAIMPGSGTAPQVGGALLRAWSDGTVEIKKIEQFSTSPSSACGSAGLCASPWIVISSPTQGYRAAADINADQIVDGVDLASVLGNWGDAPRVPFPPSDCPLNLVNP
jgi:hypothetical protein